MSREIPIRNVYYMLCYAWNCLDELEDGAASSLDGITGYDFLARMLNIGVDRLIRRGLGRGYSTTEEVSQTLRGKIDFSQSIKRNTMQELKLACCYDVFDYDTHFNRIIKATIGALLRYEELARENRDGLISVRRYFGAVTDVIPTGRLFACVQFGRSDAHYEFIIRLCEFIIQHMMVDEQTGTTRFIKFSHEDPTMWKLFELFVYHFYCVHAGNRFKVFHGRQIPWAIAAGQDTSCLPVMITDTILQERSDDSLLIIDTKYYGEAMGSRYGDRKKLRSNHLYQIYTYVRNAADNLPNTDISGILLYPKVDENVDCDYDIQGNHIAVKMIDLNQDWQDIHQELMKLIGAENAETA